MSVEGHAHGGGVLGAVARSAPLPIAVVDRSLHIIEVNQAFRRVASRVPGGLEGHPLGHTLPGLLPETLDAALRAVTERREPVLGVRLGEARNPTDRMWSVSAFPVIGQEELAVLVEDVTDRLLIERQASAAAARVSLLLEAAFAVGSTLEVDDTVDEVTKVLVPAFADQVIVDLLPADTVTVAAGHPGARHVEDRPPPSQLPSPTPQPPLSPAARTVMETGQASLLDITDSTAIDHVARSPEHRAALAAERVHSFCCVPLTRLDRTIGLLSAYAFGTRPGFGEHDLTLLREVAGRTSTALGHATSFDLARRTAVELQRSLLPAALPSSPTAEVASRYVPGRQATSVGGDWYDVIKGAAGRTAFAIGDVMGRGVHAAAMMGQIRTALRTLASADPQPGELLERLDEVVRDLDLAPFATCLYGVYDPVTRRLCVASAGHLPPLLLDPSGHTEPVPVPVSPPLGLSGGFAEECDVVVADGSVLALYTDGLVEQPGEPLQSRLRLLHRSLSSTTGTLAERCETVLADLVPTLDAADDVALLLACLHGVPGGLVARAPVRADPTCSRSARGLVTELAEQWRFTAELDEVAVMVSELVTNAVRYGRGSRTLTLVRLPDRLCVEVGDSHESHPRLRPSNALSERGRGLAVVAALAHRWGSRATSHGKAVWFEARTREPAPQDSRPSAVEVT